MKRDFFDFENEFYKPLWVRLVILAVCFGWGYYEYSKGSLTWALLFIIFGVACTWGFFIRTKEQDE